MKSREISRSKIGPFSLACTDPYIGIGWEYQSTDKDTYRHDGRAYSLSLLGHGIHVNSSLMAATSNSNISNRHLSCR